MVNDGIKTHVPSLPPANAVTGVDVKYIGRLLNVLRLYFVQLDSANSATTVALENTKRYTLVMT